MKNIELEPRKFVCPEYVFGAGTRLLACNYAEKLAVSKLLLVTDQGIMKTPWYSELIDDLNDHGLQYEVYSSVSPNPRDYEVIEGAKMFHDQNCNLLMALGGGSVIDCAKGIGVVTTNHADIGKFEGVDLISVPIPPLICIPTTAGSSADVSQFAIINNVEERYKMAIISKALVPDVSLIDPVLLSSMDNYLTACTGMDALSHAFEAYVSNANSPFTDLYALEAIRLIDGNLREYVNSNGNEQSQGKLMLASLYAGLAFSNASLGCVHSLSHSLGGYLDLAHGECNAIMLSHVVDYNFFAARERYMQIAKVLNVYERGLTDEQIKRNLTLYLYELKHELGISANLTSKGIGTDLTPVLAEKAINDPCNATNPRPPSKSDLIVVYNEAL